MSRIVRARSESRMIKKLVPRNTPAIFLWQASFAEPRIPG
jgi:hypothetical protein